MHLDGDVATIGISQFAVDQLTDLIMIDLPAVGTKLTAGKSFGEIESVKAVSDLYAPVCGEVIEVNSAVTGDVQLLAEDPFADGLAGQGPGRRPGRGPGCSITRPTSGRWPTRLTDQRLRAVDSRPRNGLRLGEDDRVMAYIANTPDDVRVMLGAIGLDSLDQLFDMIPPEYRLTRPLAIPEALGEMELTGAGRRPDRPQRGCRRPPLLPRRRELRPLHPGRRRQPRRAGRVLHGLHALSARGEPGDAPAAGGNIIVADVAHSSENPRLGPATEPQVQDTAIAKALASAVDAGQDSVKRGPELLAALRDAGVVDAGGYGLTIIFAGVVAALRGDDPPSSTTMRRRASPTPSTARAPIASAPTSRSPARA